MTVAAGVLRITIDKARCPVVDLDTGRCSSDATQLVQVGSRSGVGAFMKVCYYHEEMMDDND